MVANDSGGDTPESIRAFVEGRDLDVPFVYDPGGKAHKAFGFAGLPGLVVIDRTDRIRFTREGYNAAEHNFLENLVEIIEVLRAPEGTVVVHHHSVSRPAWQVLAGGGLDQNTTSQLMLLSDV